MNKFKLFLCLWFIAAFCTSAAALDIQQGIHGMKWGSSAHDYSELTKVKEVNQAAYYINSTMLYQTANQPVRGVFYGFYKDQLFAVFIKMSLPDQYSQLERQFTAKYGKPKTTYNSSGRQTAHRWIDKDVTIKLKMKASPMDFKLAIYYSPLADKLDQEQLEEKIPEPSAPAPAGSGQPVKSKPLLD